MAFTDQQLTDIQSDFIKMRDALVKLLTKVPPPAALTVGTPTSGGNVDAGFHAYAYSFVGPAGESVLSPLAGVNIATNKTVHLTAIALGPTGTTARNLYRTTADTVTFKLVPTGTSLADNTSTTFTDDKIDTDLTTSPPTDPALAVTDQYTLKSDFDYSGGQLLEHWVYENAGKGITLSISKNRNFGLDIRISQDPNRPN